MTVNLHPHARNRLAERGATEEEVILAVEAGERFEAKFGRVGFRRNVPFKKRWRGKRYRIGHISCTEKVEPSFEPHLTSPPTVDVCFPCHPLQASSRFQSPNTSCNKRSTKARLIQISCRRAASPRYRRN